MLWKGSTAIDGLSCSLRGVDEVGKAAVLGAAPAAHRQTRKGRSMFLTLCSPKSSNAPPRSWRRLRNNEPLYRGYLSVEFANLSDAAA